MTSHAHRSKYFIVDSDGEKEIDLASSCPMHAAAAHAVGGAQPAAVMVEEPKFVFGWMFGKPLKPHTLGDDDIEQKLWELGTRMMQAAPAPTNHAGDDPDAPGIPAGYTYLGQFLAHEITFDKILPTEVGIAATQPNWRSPRIDLDSLYGAGPGRNPELYQADGVRLKIGTTYHPSGITFPNDLPRDNEKRALISDERNDDNLAIAQLHVAFICFHNKMVDTLQPEYPDNGKLFKAAQEQVVRHFQWIIVHDYLPRLVNKQVFDTVLAQNRTSWIKPGQELFMPLEFSAAAFRIGHSMIRQEYAWNRFRNTKPPKDPASLADMFSQTARSGSLGGNPRLKDDWIIDWRRFFNFKDVGESTPAGGFNMARRLDTAFELRLNGISAFNHQGLTEEQRAITIRNLKTGFRVGLPTGEEVATRIKNEVPLTNAERDPLTHAEVVGMGPYKDLLDDPVFNGRTPLWFYILREAELEFESTGENKLGAVGSRIIAETLIGLIRESKHSILPDWTPERFGRTVLQGKPKRFDMIDLLKFADVINPLG